MSTPEPTLSPDVDIAASCFFNALLRESDHWHFAEDAPACTAVLPVDGAELHLRIAHRSASGECRFRWPVIEVGNGRQRTVDFETALDRILATPSLVGAAVGNEHAAFRERVIESRNNVLSSLASRDDIGHLQHGALTFAEAEQGLLAGHAFHPAPKSRAPFGWREARRYCPELRACFALAWWAAAPEIIAGETTRAGSAGGFAASLLPPELAQRLPDGFTALPMHPWQARHLRQIDHVRALQAEGALRWLGKGEREWLPTSSHRSLYCEGRRWMIKGSLSVRLTNSLRLLTLKEVTRGLKLDRWTSNDVLGERFPGFAIMQEPAWLGWRGCDDAIDPASLIVFRENPLYEAPDTEAVVLATLTQQPLRSGGSSPLATRIRSASHYSSASPRTSARQWFLAFCEQVLTPLFGLAVEDGIVLLAHQQNVVLRMDAGWPIGMYYRDCQGSGVSDRFLERYDWGKARPENHWSRETVRRYFLYYLLVNTTFAVTGAMAADGLIDEETLLRDLRIHLDSLRMRFGGDHDCLEHALEATQLETKGNFFCYLRGINEATMADPRELYRPIANPLVRGLRATDGIPWQRGETA